MKVMSVIHFLVRLEVVVAVISGHDDVLHSSHGADAVPDDPQDCGQSPVQSQEVFVLQHGADGVPAQRDVEGGGEAGPGVEGQQQLQGGGANDAALRQGGHRGQEEGGVLPDTEGRGWRARHGQTCRMPCHGPGVWGRSRCRTV